MMELALVFSMWKGPELDGVEEEDTLVVSLSMTGFLGMLAQKKACLYPYIA